jgi:hypothetical protein
MPEWAGDGTLFTGFPEDNVNPPAILGPDESSLMENFFRNPNGAPMADPFNDWIGEHANIKTDATGFGQVPGYDQTPQTPHGPPVTLGIHSAPSQLTHSHQQPHVPGNAHMMQYPEHNINAGAHEDVNAMNAAYRLQQMQMAGQRTSNSQVTARHMNGVGAGNWPGTAGGYPMMGGPGQQGGNENLRSPLTSSGRQSSHSYHSQQQQFYNTNPLYLPQEQWSAPISNSEHPLMSPTHQYAHQHNNHGFNVFPGHPVRTGSQSAQPRYQNVQRPTSLEYGTDDSFSGGRYEPPPGHVPREDEKGANLNSVPFAPQLAAQAQSHAHPFTPQPLSHSQQHHTLPINTNFPNIQSSPNHRGGLPNSTPVSANYNRNFSATEMTRGSMVASPDMSDDAEFDDPQPRKRRKSGARGGESSDDEYTPTGHVKMPKSRRSSKAVKVDNSNNDYATTPHTITTSKSRSSKRRKMSTSGRSSPGSQEYTTPRGNQSETPEAETKTSSKKKKGQIQARNNLTEEEKRQNHIKSEKVRRDLIKAQYDALDDLVPGLKSGKSGLSRADVLLEIVNFVENVARGNERAEQILATMSPSGGAGPSGGVG